MSDKHPFLTDHEVHCSLVSDLHFYIHYWWSQYLHLFDRSDTYDPNRIHNDLSVYPANEHPDIHDVAALIPVHLNRNLWLQSFWSFPAVHRLSLKMNYCHKRSSSLSNIYLPVLYLNLVHPVLFHTCRYCLTDHKRSLSLRLILRMFRPVAQHTGYAMMHLCMNSSSLVSSWMSDKSVYQMLSIGLFPLFAFLYLRCFQDIQTPMDFHKSYRS